MLTLKNIIPILSTIFILTFISGYAMYYLAKLFFDSIYLYTLSHYFFLVLTFITAVFFVQFLIFKVYLKNKIISTFLQGLTCAVIEVSLIFLITVPVFGIVPKSLLLHFLSVASVCFFIPFVYNAIKKLLNMPIES